MLDGAAAPPGPASVVPAWWPAGAVRSCAARSEAVRRWPLTCGYALLRTCSDPPRSRWQCGGQGYESPQLHPRKRPLTCENGSAALSLVLAQGPSCPHVPHLRRHRRCCCGSVADVWHRLLRAAGRRPRAQSLAHRGSDGGGPVGRGVLVDHRRPRGQAWLRAVVAAPAANRGVSDCLEQRTGAGAITSAPAAG